MAGPSYKVVGLGEILWDMLPTGKQLGGAPSNFAYISTLLEGEGIVASRTGNDALGREAAQRLTALGLTTEFLQTDDASPTGTVQVQVDRAGQPKFEIAEAVAWDFLEWTPQWQSLASGADAICFGSLAQRGTSSRATIHRFLEAAQEKAVCVFDVNLRQAFFSREIVAISMQHADIVKLNDDELPRIMQLFGLDHHEEIASARALMEQHHLKLICVTRGCRGSLLMNSSEMHEHPGYQIRVADAVGAGDAFTAGLVHQYMRGSSLPEMNEMANRVGAWVASKIGAMPSPGRDGIT